MANEVFKGLFGFSPQELTQQREDADTARNYKVAQLDPFQEARFQASQGYSQAGRSFGDVAKKLFNIQDPQMKEAAIMDNAFKNLQEGGGDPTSSQGLMAMAQQVKAQGGSPQMMERLFSAHQGAKLREAKLGSEVALAGQRNRESDPILKLTADGKYTTESIAAFKASKGDFSVLKFRNPNDEKKRSDFAQKLIEEGKPEGSPEFQKKMEAYTNAEIKGTATKGTTTFNMPGTKDPIDVLRFVDKLQATVLPHTRTMDAADKGLALLKDVEIGNVPAWNAVIKSVVSLMESTNVSDRDVKNAGDDPSILGGISNWASKLTTGVPSKETRDDVKRILQILRKVSKNKKSVIVNNQAEQLKGAGLTNKQINNLLSSQEGFTRLSDGDEKDGAKTPPKGDKKPVAKMSLEELRAEANKEEEK